MADSPKDRANALMDGYVETFESAAREGWDGERLQQGLVDVERANGFWRESPTVDATLGVDLGVASAGVSLNDRGEIGAGARLGIPASRDGAEKVLDRMSDPDVPMAGGTGAGVDRHVFIDFSSGENGIRAGMGFSVEADIDTRTPGGRPIRGGMEVFVNGAGDGTVVIGASGEAVPALLRGRVPVGVGGTYSAELIDADTVVERYGKMFEGMTESGVPGGEAYAREVMYNVLDAHGAGGGVPVEKLMFAAAIGEHELTGRTRFAFDDSHLGALGENLNSFLIERVEGNLGFYRINDGVLIKDNKDSVYGSTVQEYEGLIDSSGQVMNGYMVEYRNGGVVTDEAWGSRGNWDSQLGNLIGVGEYQDTRTSERMALKHRDDFVAGRRAELDALAETDLSASRPSMREAVWERDLSGHTPLDRIDARLETVMDEAREGISRRAESGELGFDDVLVGKVLAHPDGVRAMVEDLRGAGVGSVDVPEHDAGDAVARARSVVQGLDGARREAGLESPVPGYSAEDDATGVGWGDYLRARAARVSEAGMDAADGIVRESFGRGLPGTGPEEVQGPELQSQPETQPRPEARYEPEEDCGYGYE